MFELPLNFTQPATMQDTFQDGNASDWTPLAGSNFTVATTPTSRIYRQSSTASNAAASWNNSDRENRSIEADIKPTAYASGTGDKWYGLVTRYTDTNNYYYVTLRNNNTLVKLDTAPFTVTSNTWYRLRFEAIGTQLRVYINGLLQLEASDPSHPTGRYGPIMYRTAAQYDDVVAVQP